VERIKLLDCVLRDGQGRQVGVLGCAHGPAILRLDGESDDYHMPHLILSITMELPSTAWPCQLHVEGQVAPELYSGSSARLEDVDLPIASGEYVQSTTL